MGCLPWDYPPPPGTDPVRTPLCNTYVDSSGGYNNSQLAFEKAMEDGGTNEACTNGCLPDCEETTYDVQVDTTSLRTDKLCQEGETREVRVYVIQNKRKWLYRPAAKTMVKGREY